VLETGQLSRFHVRWQAAVRDVGACVSPTEQSMAREKKHQIEIIIGDRYIIHELNEEITITRGDGKLMGKGRWHENQIVNFSSVSIPDDVFLRIERELKKQMDAHWGEDY
jgi:hypothetical protein